MEPYNQNLPFVRLANDGKSLLDRMVEAGIPLTRALQYFRDNPDGSALETIKLAAEDVVPFYGNYRNGGSISDYAKEAALMFTPAPGTRLKVRTMPDGTPNLKDLGAWYANKAEQLGRVEREIMKRDPAAEVQSLQDEINRVNNHLEMWERLKNNPDYPQADIERYMEEDAARLKSLTDELNNKTLEILDYNGMTHKDYVDKFGGWVEGYDNMPFLDRQIRNEYGKGMTRDEIDRLYDKAWSEYQGIIDIQDYINNYH